MQTSHYTLATEDLNIEVIFDFGYLQHRMREENKAGRRYTASRHAFDCLRCRSNYRCFPLNGIYGHPELYEEI